MTTAEEAKQECIAAMGKELGIQYAELWQEVADLNLTWLEFVELFGTSEKRVELLNRAAGGFFRIVQNRLWESIALHIARLTDPPLSLGSKSKANLTVRNLPDLIDILSLKIEVDTLCTKALASSQFARDWRNRHIAHRDLQLALASSALPLPAVSKKEVAVALAALADVMNAVARHYLDSETAFGHVTRINGALELLYIIDDGVEAETVRRKRIENGDYADLEMRPRHL